MPSTMTLQEALHFKMPYGKYNGKSLEYISKSRRGYGYLQWMWGEGGMSKVGFLGQKSISQKLKFFERF